MLWPFPNNINITTPWDDPRPISNPGLHPHGAIDIGLAVGSRIIAPERGTLRYYFAVRPEGGMYWESGEMVGFPFRNYFYDMFGGIAILYGSSGLTHVFAHLYMNPMYNQTKSNWVYTEQKKDNRFPLFNFMSEDIEVFEGADLGKTGNSGYSTASHCHYEIHKGYKWQDWKDRIDPEKIEWEEFE